MAGELNIRATLSFSKGSAKVNRSESVSVTVTGDAYNSGVHAIGLTEEILLQGTDLGTLGYVFIQNLDATNFVRVGITGSYSIKLKAGEIALFRAAADIYAIADTAICNVEYVLIEE